VRDFNVKAWVIALMLALLPCVANAVGLGRFTMLSALGDPLNAEIDLLSVSKEEAASLGARLAASDAYRRANLQYNPALTGARVTVERRPNGQPYVKITTTRPVNEPFIDLLVEITSSSGRLMREYTVLVDPPGVGAPPATTAAAPPSAPVARPAPAPEPPVTAAAPAVRRPAAVAPAAGAREYGPVQRGENLSKIARGVMPEGVTLEQMLVGLYRSNPDAFINKNLNLVKTGRILRVPDKEELAAIAPTDARKEYRAQVTDWNSYRQGVADSAGPARAEGRSAASGRISTKVEDKAGGEPKDVVRLSRGEPPGGAGAGKGKPLGTAERIRALEEEVTAREKALNEANERIGQLEKTLKDMQKLVELKSPGMAAAQQKAQEAAKPKPEAKPEPKPEAKAMVKPEAVPPSKPELAAAPKSEPAKPEPAKPEPAKPAAPADAKADAKSDARAPDAKADAKAPDAKADAKAPDAKADAKAEAPKPEAAASPEQPKPKPKVVVTPPPPPPAPDLVDQAIAVVTDPIYLAAGGGVLVLGLLALWLARRRRGAGDEEPRAAPILGRTSAPVAGTAAAATAAAVAPSIAAPPPPPADEVDPLAEAEVYIAYGRDAQAEEILKEALAKNPGRQDAQVKLLEIYAARKDKSAFNKLAADFHKQTGGTGDAWLAVAAMGYALDAANPLYEAGRHADAPTAAAAPASDLDFELGGDTSGVATDITLDSGASRGLAHDTTAVLDAGDIQRMAASGEPTPAPLMPDFTLDIPAAGDARSKTDIHLEEPVPTQDGHMIDFQIELPKSEVDQTQVMATEDPNAGLDFKLDIPDLNLGDTAKPDIAVGGEKDGHWYDVQSKFDLAKAYQEMGDKDGAKDILQEVIKEGDTEQQAQAKQLLETLA
jgi:pilus assembly protein FimV